MCLSLTKKNNAQLITWSFLMIQWVSFTSAAFEAFVEACLCFLVSASAKKHVEAIKFLGILKKYVFKHAFLSFTQFQTWFLNGDHLLYYSQMSVFSFHIFFCSFISVFKKLNIETMLPLPYSYNWQKLNNKMNEKRNQEYQSMDQYGPWICN